MLKQKKKLENELNQNRKSKVDADNEKERKSKVKKNDNISSGLFHVQRNSIDSNNPKSAIPDQPNIKVTSGNSRNKQNINFGNHRSLQQASG